MLQKELSGDLLNKSDHRRALLPCLNGRNHGSVEFKHQNISAVLKALSEDWISGYKPRFNYQSTLEDAVLRWLTANPDWVLRRKLTADQSGMSDPAELFVEPAPTLSNQPPPEELEHTLRVARKYDNAARDERNRALGRAGEEFVFRREQAVLRRCGREDLASKVEWVSEVYGDGAGYHISSFAPNGRPRLIEVKTTNGWERSPFYISQNEIDVAHENRDTWSLFRLWKFSRSPRAFELRPPLEQHVSLTAATFKASFETRH